MRKYRLEYGRLSLHDAADIWIFEPGSLAVYRSLNVVVIGEPRDYNGVTVTNGIERIVLALQESGIRPVGAVYVEYWPSGMDGRKGVATLDEVQFQWGIGLRGGEIRIVPNNPSWWRLQGPVYDAIMEGIGGS